MILPEYAYTTEAKQPAVDSMVGILTELVESSNEGLHDEADWVGAIIPTIAQMSTGYENGGYAAMRFMVIVGYLAASQRVPILLIDPASVLQRGGK